MLRMCWGEIVSPGHDLGLPGAVQSPNTLPMSFAHREDSSTSPSRAECRYALAPPSNAWPGRVTPSLRDRRAQRARFQGKIALIAGQAELLRSPSTLVGFQRGFRVE